MLVCSCAVISDHDIELALLDLMSRDDAPLPTPGVVWRHLAKKMNCCGCAPLAVDTIYAKLEALEARGLVSPHLCASVKVRWRKLEEARASKAATARRDLSPATLADLAELEAA